MTFDAAADTEPTDADLERADALIALGRHEAARESLARVLAREPGNVEALCLLAQALKEAGAPAEMLSVAERANAVAPDEEWPHRLRALALLDLDRAPEGVEAALAAVR
ncbi:MAG: tetratricopeptide repeat protein, partial [Actinomadura sp.]